MLKVSLLGPVEAVVDGERRPIGSHAQRTLLAALALRPGSVVSSDRLIDVIWEGDPPPSAVSALHAYVSRLRRTVGGHHVESRSPGYSLDAGTDVASFELLVSSHKEKELSRALEMWRGEPFGELSEREPFRGEALRLLELRAAVEERRVEAALPRDPGWATAEAEGLCEREPLREARWALLARAQASAGRRAEAVRTLQRARDHLAEVGLDPSALLRDLEDRLLTGAPPIAGPAPRPPLAPTHLVGRDHDVAALAELLGPRRLVTLVGPGGVGKTHLARAVTRHRSADTTTHWCDLAGLEDPEGVVPAVARAVGASVTGRIEETMLETLWDRRVFLVVDNCEHLISEVARIIERVLSICSEVVVLATSREPLSVPAEWVYRVHPLDIAGDAVDLFQQRARAGGVSPDLLDRDTAQRICRLLDGLPLAIEMAAARVRGLGVARLAERLQESLAVLSPGPRSGSARHRTLEQVVGWSVGLLDPPERRVLERVTVFAGRFDLEGAEVVAGGAPVQPDEVAGLLSALVDRSLLVVEHTAGDVRYRLLDTVRRVVRQWVDADDDAVAQRRHRRYHADRAEEAGRGLLGADESHHVGRLLSELPDLRAAAFRSLTAEPAVSVRICAALYPVVYHRLRSDIAGWGAHVFAAVEGSGDPLVPTVGAMAALGAVQAGDIGGAFEICRRARESAGLGADLFHVAEVETDAATYLGDLERAVACAEEMLRLARESGDERKEALALVNLTLGNFYSGDGDAAAGAISRLRRMGIPSATLAAWIDYAEGEVLLDRDPGRAAELLDRAVDTARQSGNRFVEGVAGLSAASIYARHGDGGTALRRFSATIRHWLGMGDWVHQWNTLRNLALLLERVGDPEGAAVVMEAVGERERPSYGEESERLDALRRRLRTSLGEERYGEALGRARGMTDRETVEFALARVDGQAS